MLSDLTEESETEMGYGTLTLQKAIAPKVTCTASPQEDPRPPIRTNHRPAATRLGRLLSRCVQWLSSHAETLAVLVQWPSLERCTNTARRKI